VHAKNAQRNIDREAEIEATIEAYSTKLLHLHAICKTAALAYNILSDGPRHCWNPTRLLSDITSK